MIPFAKIIRNPDQTKEVTGQIAAVNESGAILKLFTMERPWLNNQNEISCIPPGKYSVIKVPATHIPYPHFAVENVPDRAGICIHKANYVIQLEGCVAVGMELKDINGDGLLDTVSSGQAFDLLFAHMPDSFELEVVNA